MRRLQPPNPPLDQAGQEQRRLGEALEARVEDVRERTVASTSEPGHDVDSVVQDSFERISRGATAAVASWIAGESMESAIEAGRETWEIFGELAVHKAASLDEVTWRCFRWRLPAQMDRQRTGRSAHREPKTRQRDWRR